MFPSFQGLASALMRLCIGREVVVMFVDARCVYDRLQIKLYACMRVRVRDSKIERKRNKKKQKNEKDKEKI